MQCLHFLTLFWILIIFSKKALICLFTKKKSNKLIINKYFILFHFPGIQLHGSVLMSSVNFMLPTDAI